MKRLGLMTLSLMLVSPALAGGAGQMTARPGTCKSIAALVASDPQFSTLRTAISAAGLTNVFSAAGSYTVFAPTNAAFAKIPSKDLAALLNDPKRLAQVLGYHVVEERATAAELRGSVSGTTLQGQDVMVKVSGNQIMINNARVIRADINACNGIVHVIDTVLMPKLEAAPAPKPAASKPAAPKPAAPKPAAPVAQPAAPKPAPITAPAAVDVTRIPALPLSGATASTAPVSTTVTAPAAPQAAAPVTETAPVTGTTSATETTTETAETTDTTATEVASNTIYDAVVADDRFSTLRSLLSDAGLTELLTSGEYTLFAPTDTAFEALPEGTLAAIASDPEVLKALLTYHVVAGRLNADQIKAGKLTTAAGTELTVTANLAPVLESSNGLIYPVDAVLLPAGFVVPTVTEEPAATTTAPEPAPVTPATATPAPVTPVTATPAPVTPVTATPAPVAPATTSTVTTAPAATTPATSAADLNTLLLQDSRFSTVRELLTQAQLPGALTTGEYTLLLPTNDAFTKLDPGKLATLKEKTELLRQVLNYHVIRGRRDAAALTAGPLVTNEGTSVTLTRDAAGLQMDGMMLGGAERIDAGNVTIYVIDSVLLPPSLR